jgi:hypothetical protein
MELKVAAVVGGDAGGLVELEPVAEDGSEPFFELAEAVSSKSTAGAMLAALLVVSSDPRRAQSQTQPGDKK